MHLRCKEKISQMGRSGTVDRLTSGGTSVAVARASQMIPLQEAKKKYQ